MKPITLTYDICTAIGWDAGNRNTRKHGRKKWSLEDRNIAAATTCKMLDEMGY